MLTPRRLLAGALILVLAAPSAFALTISFSALDIATAMAGSGAVTLRAQGHDADVLVARWMTRRGLA